MLINRKKYVEEATLFRNADLIKVVTGVRRCGKSSLLVLARRKIESEGFLPGNLTKWQSRFLNSVDLEFLEMVNGRSERRPRPSPIGSAAFEVIEDKDSKEALHDVASSQTLQMS